MKYKEWFASHREQVFDDYFSLVRIPSVSGQKEHKADCLRCATHVETRLRRIGLDVQVWETSYNPVIFGEKVVDPALPTVLLYGHYDVQPVEPVELWKSDPFEPVERGGRVYARGASDNKGQCSYTLSALEAFLESDKRLNVKVVIEGDEETGSKGLMEIVGGKGRELAADSLLIVDLEIPAMDRPGVTLGMRGVMTMRVDVVGAARDVHSGAFGGVLGNPARALCSALASLWDERGRVAVEGFYDGIVPMEEKELLDQTVDYAAMLKEVGGRATGNEEGKKLFEANWLEPTVEINGLGSGYVGDEVKTIIPGRARAMLSMRLVPGQEPGRVAGLVKVHLEKKIANGMGVEVELGHGGVGVRTSPRAKVALLAKEAYEEVTGKKASFFLSGATVPVALALQEACGGEMIGVGYGMTRDEIHAPNESFGLDQFESGFLTIATILDKAAQ